MTRSKVSTNGKAPPARTRRDRRRARTAVLVLWGIAPTLLAAAQAGEVTGRIVDSIWGQPIAAATVTLHPTGPDANRQTMSDTNGEFAFVGLSPGQYSVTAEADGYIPRPGARRGFWTNAGIESAVQPFGTAFVDWMARPESFSASVSADNLVSEIRIQLARGGTIHGHVRRRSDATPVSRATVVLYRRVFVDGREELSPVRRVQTDRDGSYRISSLPPEAYLVAVEDRRFAVAYFRNSRFTQDRAEVRVPAGAELGRIDIFVANRATAR